MKSFQPVCLFLVLGAFAFPATAGVRLKCRPATVVYLDEGLSTFQGNWMTSEVSTKKISLKPIQTVGGGVVLNKSAHPKQFDYYFRGEFTNIAAVGKPYRVSFQVGFQERDPALEFGPVEMRPGSQFNISLENVPGVELTEGSFQRAEVHCEMEEAR